MKKFGIELEGSIRCKENCDVVIRELKNIEYVVSIETSLDKPSPEEIMQGLSEFLSEEEIYKLENNIWVGWFHLNIKTIQ